MNKLYLYLTVLFSVFLCFQANAQDSSQWKLSDKSVFTYNGAVINANTAFEDIKANFGKPSSNRTYANGDILYIYESLGMSISTNDKHKVNFVGFNYTWDGDKRFPETSFEGTLQVGNHTVTKKSSGADFEKIEGIEFKCPIPVLCAGKGKKANVSILIGFQEANLTQIGFSFE